MIPTLKVQTFSTWLAALFVTIGVIAVANGVSDNQPLSTFGGSALIVLGVFRAIKTANGRAIR